MPQVITQTNLAPEEIEELIAKGVATAIKGKSVKEIEPIYSEDEIMEWLQIKDKRTMKKVCAQHGAEPVTAILNKPYYHKTQFINQTWKK